jgi:hypothetical protein
VLDTPFCFSVSWGGATLRVSGRASLDVGSTADAPPPETAARGCPNCGAAVAGRRNKVYCSKQCGVVYCCRRLRRERRQAAEAARRAEAEAQAPAPAGPEGEGSTDAIP